MTLRKVSQSYILYRKSWQVNKKIKPWGIFTRSKHHFPKSLRVTLLLPLSKQEVPLSVKLMKQNVRPMKYKLDAEYLTGKIFFDEGIVMLLL